MVTSDVSSKINKEELDDDKVSSTSKIDFADRTGTEHGARSSSDYDFTNIEHVRNYLEDHHGLRSFDLQRLSGGTANYVYRMIGQGEDDGRRWILKHAAAQLASNSAFSLPQSRIHYEAKILSNLPQDASCGAVDESCSVGDRSAEKIHARTVSLNFFDEDRKLLCMQDVGDRNLKDAYASLSNEQAQEIGTELGRWLAKLHGETPLSSVLTDGQANNHVGMTIARYTYRNLAEALRQATQNEEYAKMGTLIDDWFGSLISADKESVCHGDFWPGNVMLQGSSATGGPSRLTVIDWEMVRVGNSATDVGQFAAEAFLLDRFHGGKGLHTSFIRSYFQSSAVKFGIKEWLYPWMTRVAVHFATHLAFWPSRSVHWANKEDTKAVSDMAVVILDDIMSETPNAVVWRVFEGIPGLDQVAREMMGKRWGPGPDNSKLAY